MVIDIQLNGNSYAIVDDSFQFKTIKKTISSTNKDSEIILGYCSTLGKAVKKIIREESGTDESAVSIMEYANKVDTLFNQIMDQFPDKPSLENKRKVNPETIAKVKSTKESNSNNLTESTPTEQKEDKEDFEF